MSAAAAHQPGTLRSRIDAMAAQPLRRSALLTPEETLYPQRGPTNNARPSAVRQVLAQAAMQMHMPEVQANAQGARHGGPEYSRLKDTLRQLKSDSLGGLGAMSAQISIEAESSKVTEHVNTQVRSMQRAFGVLADTLEDEASNLRAADAQVWEQLKVHAGQFDGIESVRSELEKTRETLRLTQSAFSSFKNDEHVVLQRRVEELAAELAESKEALRQQKQDAAAERQALRAEVNAIRRDTTAPVEEWRPIMGKLEKHIQDVERSLPPLQAELEAFQAGTHSSQMRLMDELTSLKQAAELRSNGQEEEASRMASIVERLGETHAQAVSRLDERLRLFRGEARGEAETQDSRLRQLAQVRLLLIAADCG